MKSVRLPEAPLPVEATDLDEARAARRRAELARDAAHRQSAEVTKVASNLRAHRSRNHFAESMGDIFRE